MMIHVDMLTHADIRALDAVRDDICVSIYLPTTPVTSEAAGDRITYKNLVTEALNQLQADHADKRRIWPLEEKLRELEDDADFWAHMADGLAVFSTPDRIDTYRLPIAPEASVEVADRFEIKPLVPILAFSGECFVLVLARGAVKLLEVTDKSVFERKVADMPRDLSHSAKRRMPKDPAPAGRIQGGEGNRVLTEQYANRINKALRRALGASSAPLILAATDELAAIYRAQNSYPHLTEAIISGNHEETPDRDLSTHARAIALAHEAKVVKDVLADVKAKAHEKLSATDLGTVAKAAVFGRVETLVVRTGITVPGAVCKQSGKVTLDAQNDASNYDVIDEIVGLTLRNGGNVLPANEDQLPDNQPLAAIFRYAA